MLQRRNLYMSSHNLFLEFPQMVKRSCEFFVHSTCISRHSAKTWRLQCVASWSRLTLMIKTVYWSCLLRKRRKRSIPTRFFSAVSQNFAQNDAHYRSLCGFTVVAGNRIPLLHPANKKIFVFRPKRQLLPRFTKVQNPDERNLIKAFLGLLMVVDINQKNHFVLNKFLFNTTIWLHICGMRAWRSCSWKMFCAMMFPYSKWQKNANLKDESLITEQLLQKTFTLQI